MALQVRSHEGCLCAGFERQQWIFNHVPVELSLHDEALIASMSPVCDRNFTTLQALTKSKQAAQAAGRKAATQAQEGVQLLVSGRPARTHAFAKKPHAYRRPELHAVPSTVTGQVRLQVNSTDSHPVLDRTLTLLELKRCQVCKPPGNGCCPHVCACPDRG